MSSVAPFRGPLQVEYCPVCSMPPEYCEFGPSWDKCKLVLQKTHPDLLAAALAQMNVSGASVASSSSSASSSAGEKKKKTGDIDEGDDGDEEVKKGTDLDGDDDDTFLNLSSSIAAPSKSQKTSVSSAGAGPGIYMSLSQRSKKKFVTTIRGWESFGLVLKDVSKLLSKKFACAASVVKSADGSGEIAMQGNILMDLPAWIVDEFPKVDKRLIWTVDKAGKKVRAF